MSDFANLRDGGRRLGDELRDLVASLADPVLVPAIPNGVPVVAGVLDVLDLPVIALPVVRGDDGVTIAPLPAIAGRDAIVVDDGVETGTVARSAVTALRESDAASVSLAAPVCSREVRADLDLRYDAVVAVVQPMVRRDLSWHYDDFDTIDEAAALQLLADMDQNSD